MVNLNKWGIYPNFKPKDAEIKFLQYSKKEAKFSVIPKNGKSILLNKKAEQPFDFSNKAKYTHKIIGHFSLSQAKKRKVILTSGFRIIVSKT